MYCRRAWVWYYDSAECLESHFNFSRYFRPKHLKHFGAQQDGGMRANNPTEAALWELGCVWPDHPSPHLVLSVGTGYQNLAVNELGPYRGFWVDGFLLRILRAFLSSPSLDGESSWSALLNRLDDSGREKFFRLTFEFEGPAAPLDDAARIPLLKQMADNSRLNLDQLTRALWASRFFFELVSEPEYLQGHYVCRGVVLCRFHDVRPLVGAICRAYTSPRVTMDNLMLFSLMKDDGFCKKCGYFEKDITFQVRQLNDVIGLSLTFDKAKRSHLASFPKPVEWFLQRQWKHGCWRQWGKASKCCGNRLKRHRAASSDCGSKRRKTR